MFGTLVLADVDQGALEFVENPDPVAAVSRNLRDRIHISCTFCRSRKVWPFHVPILYLQVEVHTPCPFSLCSRWDSNVKL